VYNICAECVKKKHYFCTFNIIPHLKAWEFGDLKWSLCFEKIRSWYLIPALSSVASYLEQICSKGSWQPGRIWWGCPSNYHRATVVPRPKNFQIEIKDSMPGFSHIYAPCQDSLTFMPLVAIYRGGSSTTEDGMMAYWWMDGLKGFFFMRIAVSPTQRWCTGNWVWHQSLQVFAILCITKLRWWTVNDFCFTSYKTMHRHPTLLTRFWGGSMF
jgi:hypothetical protein